ncbi:transcription initiation factor IIB [Salinibaculum rarum]|uniref:transcription initiation factor IIB n=1 Tax=Salinibaculum rarum TaxID=3058903 RepID=UPI00265D7B7A|nr:TFIIB-type zinc ribbon-containing protein [Salinibaculum sp. KK48]
MTKSEIKTTTAPLEPAETTENTDETPSEATEDTTTCPECGGDLRTNDGRAERACVDCGLVVESDNIDRGPEWRAFNQQEKEEKTRVGAPTTNMMHDKGLSTNIGWQNKDAYGNSLSSSQREKMQRLRTWNERFRTQDSRDRNLKQALSEIDRMASALGLPQDVRETSSVIYRRALEEDLLPGRSIEGVATASLYAAARKANNPRSLDEMADVSRVEKKEFERAYRYIIRELSLEMEPADPEKYIPRNVSTLAADHNKISEDDRRDLEQTARELVETARNANLHSGKSPTAIAAAAIYAAGLLENLGITQSELSNVIDVSEVTIRNRYQEILDEAGYINSE